MCSRSLHNWTAHINDGGDQDTGSGTLKSAEGYDDAIDGEVVYGADWLLVDPDNEHATPNLKLIIK